MKPRSTMIACALSIFFLSFLGLNGQASAPAAVKGAIATVTSLDRAHNTATIEVSNSSAKDISAFVFSYSIIYSDGQTVQGEFTEDWGPLLSAARSTLHPGSQHVETISLTQRESASVTDLNVEVTLVAYGDQTVEVRSNDSLERLVAERSAQAQAFQRSADAITRALNDPGDEHPVATALQSITRLRDSIRASHSREANVGYLNETVNRLQAAPKGADQRAYLTQELTDLQAKATLYGKYAQLRRLQ